MSFPPHPPEPVDPDWQLEPERPVVESIGDPPVPEALGCVLLVGCVAVVAMALALGLGVVLFGR